MLTAKYKISRIYAMVGSLAIGVLTLICTAAGAEDLKTQGVLKQLDFSYENGWQEVGEWLITGAESTNPNSEGLRRVRYDIDTRRESKQVFPVLPNSVLVEKQEGLLRNLRTTWPLSSDTLAAYMNEPVSSRKFQAVMVNILLGTGDIYDGVRRIGGHCAAPRRAAGDLAMYYRNDHRGTGSGEVISLSPFHETILSSCAGNADGNPPSLVWHGLPSTPNVMVAEVASAPYLSSENLRLFGIGSLPILDAMLIATMPGSTARFGYEYEHRMGRPLWLWTAAGKEKETRDAVTSILKQIAVHKRIRAEFEPNSLTYQLSATEHAPVLDKWSYRLLINDRYCGTMSRAIGNADAPGAQKVSREIMRFQFVPKRLPAVVRAWELAPVSIVQRGPLRRHSLGVRPKNIAIHFKKTETTMSGEALRRAGRSVIYSLLSIGCLDLSHSETLAGAGPPRQPWSPVLETTLRYPVQKLGCVARIYAGEKRVLEMPLETLLNSEGPAKPATVEWRRMLFAGTDTFPDVFRHHTSDGTRCIRVTRQGKSAAWKPLAAFEAVAAGTVEFAKEGEPVSFYWEPTNSIRLELEQPHPRLLYDYVVSGYVQRNRKRIKEQRERAASARRHHYYIESKVKRAMAPEKRANVLRVLERIFYAKVQYYLLAEIEGAENRPPSWDDLAPWLRGSDIANGDRYVIGDKKKPVKYIGPPRQD